MTETIFYLKFFEKPLANFPSFFLWYLVGYSDFTTQHLNVYHLLKLMKSFFSIFHFELLMNKIKLSLLSNEENVSHTILSKQWKKNFFQFKLSTMIFLTF